VDPVDHLNWKFHVTNEKELIPTVDRIYIYHFNRLLKHRTGWHTSSFLYSHLEGARLKFRSALGCPDWDYSWFVALPPDNCNESTFLAHHHSSCLMALYKSSYWQRRQISNKRQLKRANEAVWKVKLSMCLINWALRHEGVRGSECIDPHFLDLGTSWMWVISLTLLPLYPRERAPRTHRIWIGWTPEPVWTTWRNENCCPHRDSNSDPLVVQLVASRYTDYAIPALKEEVGKEWKKTEQPCYYSVKFVIR
jgi:hypothetical protein